MITVRSMHRQLCLGFIGCCLPFVSAQVQAQQSLPQSVTLALQQAGVPTSALAVIVQPVDRSAPKLAIHEDVPMSPASTMKLVTSGVALEVLGPTYKWKTQLLSDESWKMPSNRSTKKNTLRGPLYLRGGGAPDLSWERLGMMLRTLYDQGIHRIEGDLILDRSFFEPSRFDLNLPPFDETPDAYYNVIPDALLVNSNLTSFELDSTQKKMQTRLSSPMARVRLNNRMTVGDFPCAQWEQRWIPPTIKTDRRHRTTITLSGEFPRDCKITNSLNILDRNLYIESLVRQLWTEMGGQWKGRAIDGTVPPTATALVEKSSDTLADNLRIINKRSDNAMTRLLYLSLGAELSAGLSTKMTGVTSFNAAEERVRLWMRQQGIDDQGFVIENGSGLSRSERISAKQMSSFLLHLSQSNWFAEFSASLPIVAVDGTMRKRLVGTVAAARARIKTGTLRDTVAVAGYVRDQQNRHWVVVGMINHEYAAKARPALDALIAWVASGVESEAVEGLTQAQAAAEPMSRQSSVSAPLQ
ncbi:D-alanyl-D-alanine carboxypeptidase/D-alanyl-D-alanine-endopeptidase [Undibacterium seohonense]|uniref:D-alanyl-D-alanine carboxypeptidase/D-alanyl-D-alanine-endopeptidase n=1 Tax=Undibacterium seohonense TaxID=1344950 RepID=A0ABR6X7U2_9BURK|nr:D-alanyl-D-alanine carboxypeptidase/D-alanyl-D-alanine-endopeptidase [Undibacterium seohonense]MBC3808987.1 D-alanyl-D-alanine carboxypeptidase/D-alanyl-D-alanine-endopeptidase [Undibacterium seohonense]